MELRLQCGNKCREIRKSRSFVVEFRDYALCLFLFPFNSLLLKADDNVSTAWAYPVNFIYSSFNFAVNIYQDKTFSYFFGTGYARLGVTL